jgi:type IV secretion system protein VirB8
MISDQDEDQKMDDQAYDWFAERYQSVVISRNRWFVMAISAFGLTILQALALICLVPLKTSVPFIIQEEKTGAISTIQPVAGTASITYGESVKKYFVARYLVLRETYDPIDLTNNYNAVNLMSDSDETRRFIRTISASNKSNPVALYANHTKRFIRVKSISFLNATTAQVRFSAVETKSDGSENTTTWIATLGFRFGSPPVLDSERLVNPVGFLVTNYRIDQEVIP